MTDYGQPQQQLPQESPHAPPTEDQTSDSKRKRGEDGPQPRAKRNRYISIACNECKRRKIKCNGEHPCQRCGNLQLECVYAPNCCSNNFKETQEYKQINAQVQLLQEQVNVLWQNLNSLRSSLGHEGLPQLDDLLYLNDNSQSNRPAKGNVVIDPALSRNQSSPHHNKYQGPTSSQYNFDLARSSLQSMGITTEDGQELGAQRNRGSSPSSPRLGRPQLHPAVQAMTEISKEEGLRLCRVYEDEMGLMYPILDMQRVQQHATLVFALGEAVSRSGNSAFGLKSEIQSDPDLEILKLVLANALVAESGGTSQLGKRLYDSCAKSADVGLQDQANLKNVQTLALVAMYLFHSDQETRSWRVIGVAARLCIELGLHRAETYNTLFSTEDERDAALRVFWSVYVLDKRWSLGTGMASALSDSDIDPKLEKPYQSSPYLSCSVDYSKIGAEVWRAFGNKDATDSSFKRAEVEFLNYQVLEWYKSIPSFLKYQGPKHPDYVDVNSPQLDTNNQPSQGLYRLQLILYLRANQMRILIYRPVLHSATQILSNDLNSLAQKVVDLAKDSIRTLTRINQSSDLYQTQQMLFNYFLVSALGVLFLAVSHAPAQFASSCKDEFYMALDLVRGLSGRSSVSERLWKTIKGLKEIGPKLGLFQRQSEADRNVISSGSRGAQQVYDPMQTQHDAASSAAMAMAGLRAGRPVDESDFFGVPGSNKSPSVDNRSRAESGTSPNGMANDLLSLFEAAGAFANGNAPGSANFGNENQAAVANIGLQQTGAANGVGMAGGHEDDFGRIMRDLF